MLHVVHEMTEYIEYASNYALCIPPALLGPHFITSRAERWEHTVWAA